MKRIALIAALILAVGCGPAVSPSVPEKPAGRSVPPCPPKAPYTPANPGPKPHEPEPNPDPAPCPNWPRDDSPPVGGDVGTAKVGGTVSPDGKEQIQIDLPGALQSHNSGGMGRGGPGTGSGLCVFCSGHHAGLWSDEEVFIGLFKWMERKPGGGYPEKVTSMVAEYAKEIGRPVPAYVQVTVTDYEWVKAATASGRMVCTTYGYSPTGRYNGQHIAHMVNVVHATNNWVAVLDNNYPGEDKYEWMDPATYKKVSESGNGGNAWYYALCKDGPPTPPKRGVK